MGHLNVLTCFVLLPQHLIQRSNPLVILFRVSFAEVILRPLYEHDWGTKLIAYAKISNHLGIIASDLHVDFGSDVLNPVEDGLFALLILLEVNHLISVNLMRKHCLPDNLKDIRISQFDRLPIDRPSSGENRGLSSSCAILFLFVRIGVCHNILSDYEKSKALKPCSNFRQFNY